MRNQYYFLLVLFLCAGQHLKCQISERITKTFDAYTYVIDTEKVTVCEVKISNTGAQDYVLWFEKGNILNLSEKEKIQLYFFKVKQDFTLYDLMVEKLLTNEQVVIFDTFLKSIKKNESFTVKVVGKDITKEKLEKFISEHMVLVLLILLI
jgi:hypothetical protein